MFQSSREVSYLKLQTSSSELLTLFRFFRLCQSPSHSQVGSRDLDNQIQITLSGPDLTLPKKSSDGNRGYVLTDAASFFGSPVQLDTKDPRECGGKNAAPINRDQHVYPTSHSLDLI